MGLRRDGTMRWQVICMPWVLKMGGNGYARIISSGQSCVPMLLTSWRKTKGQISVLLTFLNQARAEAGARLIF